ncbi:hypothetical protein HK102_006500 [Quaeritorhiza haematococci]|nr:hypothetical protein HK102_006500 [Quaeritorhiza haematococci]
MMLLWSHPGSVMLIMVVAALLIASGLLPAVHAQPPSNTQCPNTIGTTYTIIPGRNIDAGRAARGGPDAKDAPLSASSPCDCANLCEQKHATAVSAGKVGLDASPTDGCDFAVFIPDRRECVLQRTTKGGPRDKSRARVLFREINGTNIGGGMLVGDIDGYFNPAYANGVRGLSLEGCLEFCRSLGQDACDFATYRVNASTPDMMRFVGGCFVKVAEQSENAMLIYRTGGKGGEVPNARRGSEGVVGLPQGSVTVTESQQQPSPIPIPPETTTITHSENDMAAPPTIETILPINEPQQLRSKGPSARTTALWVFGACLLGLVVGKTIFLALFYYRKYRDNSSSNSQTDIQRNEANVKWSMILPKTLPRTLSRSQLDSKYNGNSMQRMEKYKSPSVMLPSLPPFSMTRDLSLARASPVQTRGTQHPAPQAPDETGTSIVFPSHAPSQSPLSTPPSPVTASTSNPPSHYSEVVVRLPNPALPTAYSMDRQSSVGDTLTSHLSSWPSLGLPSYPTEEPKKTKLMRIL